MIAIDTSSLIAYFSGQKGKDVRAIDFFLDNKQAVLPPVVLSEILSDPKLSSEVKNIFKKIPLLDLLKDFWIRVGNSRAKLLGQGLKARLADTMIAQSCIDYDLALITRDKDFRHFKKLGLKIFTEK